MVVPPAFQLDGLALDAMDEFSDAADYFWKSMDFIDDEILRELKKIAIYFPLTGDTNKDALALLYGEKRWSSKHRKIKKTFSYLIATGNLFTSTAMFESYLLRMCKEIERTPNCRAKMTEFRGNSVERYFRYIRYHNIRPENIELHNETDAIIRLRNCIYHANGMLELSRDSAHIRRIVDEKLYFESVNQVGTRRKDHEPLAFITCGNFGEQVQVEKLLGWYSAGMYRNYFCALYMNARKEGIITRVG